MVTIREVNWEKRSRMARWKSRHLNSLEVSGYGACSCFALNSIHSNSKSYKHRSLLWSTWRRHLWGYFLSAYLHRRASERAWLVVEIDSSSCPRDVDRAPRSTRQRNSLPLRHIATKIAVKTGQMICFRYKICLYSRRERADKSTRNNDTGHLFVQEGKPASEVNASVRYHRDGVASLCTKKSTTFTEARAS